ncbi:SRPBCC family protein [Tissierella sp. Yu-01]|jgi:Fe-S cluster assembly iron-binding protein IscA|uniref:SRPBCC family protein n=1 Tax=Tissierella sp. Yu-01 TaxID=3035694 RepID=UPI00240D9B1F|nr:SRPBCC family protein [Tissierella sp. Yu-01]WFA09209.1 SRPBCC family protein [Tissierella sp. Yu-01]
MAVSNIKAFFLCQVQKVWEIVTDIKNYTWRIDLSKTEILNENKFIEYTKDGFLTQFTITVTEPYKRWEFDMENSNIRGHWIGVFTEKDGGTEIDFTEDVTAKKFIMKPFMKAFLKKQQELFISDFKETLY